MLFNLLKTPLHYASVFFILLLFQWLGTQLSAVTQWPVPGIIGGMILLFVTLLIWPGLLRLMTLPSNRLLGHLSLLFIPAGAGIMTAGHLLADNGVALVTTIVGSTVITMVLTGWSVQGMQKQKNKKDKKEVRGAE